MADRVSQAMVEVLGQPASANARVSQSMVEVGGQMAAGAAAARVSQVMVEVLASTAEPSPVAAGGSGRWFYDLWFEDGLWNEGELAP
jgi:hypothetical protein